MAAVRVTVYRPRRFRSPYGRRDNGLGKVAGVAAGVVLASAVAHSATAKAHAQAHGQPAVITSPAAARAVAYARAELGKPYLWGGTGPDAYDCSGLAMEAWASAGVSLERTSQQQWASEKHVTVPQPGDLVFFAGSDGTPASPGHVGIVTDPGKHLMIDAYGVPQGVEYDTYGSAASPATGLAAVVGFTDPEGSQS